MNKRIQEMIAERGMFQDSELYELAEAVIRECASVVDYYRTRNEPISGRNIKQHFGVE